MFFSQATIGKKHTKTNILLFLADIHTYKLTFVSFFFTFFFRTFPLFQSVNWHSTSRTAVNTFLELIQFAKIQEVFKFIIWGPVEWVLDQLNGPGGARRGW